MTRPGDTPREEVNMSRLSVMQSVYQSGRHNSFAEMPTVQEKGLGMSMYKHCDVHKKKHRRPTSRQIPRRKAK